MTDRTTVRLPDQLLKRAKRKAAAEGRTLTALMEEGLRYVVRDSHKPAAFVLPRVSVATGGVMPGVDLSDTARLQEIDDIEYLSRAKQRL